MCIGAFLAFMVSISMSALYNHEGHNLIHVSPALKLDSTIEISTAHLNNFSVLLPTVVHSTKKQQREKVLMDDRADNLMQAKGRQHESAAIAAAEISSFDPQIWKMEVHYKGPTMQNYGGGLNSQVSQDKTVMQIFDNKKGGYFIDCAANHATRISNTKALETRLGWTGLCIEPHPKYHQGYANRRCTLVDAVVGQKDNEKITFVFADGFSGIAGFDQKKTRA
jgi:hypothetical protein